MPKKTGKGKKKTVDSGTPRENENDIIPDVRKEQTQDDEQPLIQPIIEVTPKIEDDAPNERQWKEEPKPEEEVIVIEERKQETTPVEAPKEEPTPVEDDEREPLIRGIENPPSVQKDLADKEEVVDEQEIAPVVIYERQPEPVVEEAPNGESSGFVVVEKKEDQTSKTEEVQIKPDHVEIQKSKAPPVGIKSMQRDIHPEINSPFRRKKTEGGLKLSLLQEPDSPIAEEPNNEYETRFEQILPHWDQVLANLAISRQKFEDLKQEPLEYHCKMYRDGEYKTLVNKWSTTLELKLPIDNNIDNETITQFNQKVKDTLDDITHFINILNDWVESKVHLLEEEAPAELLENKIEEVKQDDDLVIEDDEHILEAERMGISSKDPQELKGLVREASLRIERGEPPVIKKQASTKSEKKREEDKEEQQNEEGSYMPYLVIGAAFLVVAGRIAWVSFKK